LGVKARGGEVRGCCPARDEGDVEANEVEKGEEDDDEEEEEEEEEEEPAEEDPEREKRLGRLA
jgi:hypothetical protein